MHHFLASDRTLLVAFALAIFATAGVTFHQLRLGVGMWDRALRGFGNGDMDMRPRPSTMQSIARMLLVYLFVVVPVYALFVVSLIVHIIGWAKA